MVELVADALSTLRFSAGSQDTGGGICCVIIQRKSGEEIVWGTADVNWGACVFDDTGETTSSLPQPVQAIVRM
jgi:hypothetical protein